MRPPSRTTILPNQIPAMTVPFVDEKGNVKQVWWLFLYNLAQEVLGTQSITAAAEAAQTIADLDADVDETDSLSLRARVSNLEKTQDDTVTPTIASVNQALMMAYDALLPDPVKTTGTGSGVTSVGLTSSDFTISGSPVTTAGSITANITRSITPTWTGKQTFAPTATGNALVVNSPNSTTTQAGDVLVTRAGSTANSVVDGPNINFQDTSASTQSAVQHSGGQTEIWQYNGAWTQVVKIDTSGNFTLVAGLAFAPATTTTAPASGGAGGLPAAPAGYATVTIGGTARKVPYY